MEKLLELANAGVKITLWGPKALSGYHNEWSLVLEASHESVALRVQKGGTDLEATITDAYDAWNSATGRGLPQLGLKVLTYEAPAADDEIPF